MLHPAPDENSPARDRMKDKVVIASGAGSVGEGWGNGKAAAFVYGKEGGSVMCVDYRLEAAEETAEEVETTRAEETPLVQETTTKVIAMEPIISEGDNFWLY